MPENPPEGFPAGIPLPADLLDDEEDAGVSPFAVANVLMRRLRLIVGLPVLAFVVVAAVSTVIGQERYLAMSKFLPTGSEGISRSSGGVVAQLTQLVGGGGDGLGPGFYMSLVQSSPLIRRAARSEYEITIREDGEREERAGTLAEIFGMNPSTEETNVRMSYGILRQMVSARVEPGTRFVVAETEGKWPELAVAVNERLLELVNEFNIQQRQTQAAAERRFVEDRMEAAKAELAAAEDSLRTFLDRNQNYEGSARLRMEAQRLERNVNFRQELYTSLASSYEQARINEVRNTPVVTVVERPAETVSPVGERSPLFNGFFAFVVALLVTLGYVLAAAYFSRKTEEHPEDYEEFRELARRRVPALLPSGVRRRLAAWHNGRRTEPARGARETPAAGEEASERRSPEAAEQRSPEAAEQR